MGDAPVNETEEDRDKWESSGLQEGRNRKSSGPLLLHGISGGRETDTTSRLYTSGVASAVACLRSRLSHLPSYASRHRT